MCLLAVLSRVHPDHPLVVAANRDEFLARPASGVTVLRDAPRTLGGRDAVGGGTWLAVNLRGVVAALTNTPLPGAPDPARRSRGELPLLLTEHATAAAAAEAFVAAVRCEDYNPCWLLVGDREGLHYLTVDGAGPPGWEPLEPGVYVLENRPLRPRSGKAARVEAALVGAPGWRGDALCDGLRGVLASHAGPGGGAVGGTPPSAAGSLGAVATGPLGVSSAVGEPPRPQALEAACVHAGPYGTRSSSLVWLPAAGPPVFHAAEGPPCEARFADLGHLWT